MALGALIPIVSELSTSASVSVLAVGDPNLWQTSGEDLPRFRNVDFRGISEIDEGLIQTLRPTLVVSPVVTGRFDCLALAVVLSDLNYAHAYRAIARDMPYPAIVLNEVRGMCPNLDFDIISLGMGAHGTH